MRGSMVLSLIALVLASKGDRTTATCDETRTYNGTWNNCDHPSWGSANSPQIRFIAQDNYSDGISEVTEDGRPSAREVTTKLFSKVPVSGSLKSALFVAWGQLVSFDVFKNSDNASEPFDISCRTRDNDDEGEDPGEIDIWCPFGEESDSIPFYRSEAEIDSGVRQPFNYATAYLDLDFVYGRTEGHAKQLREIDKGMMKINGSLPERFENGSWLQYINQFLNKNTLGTSNGAVFTFSVVAKVADNRTTQFPVTFALHTMFLIEHNRCCKDVALSFRDKDDEEIFQACRANTIAAYQHITRNDFAIRLLSMDVASAYDGVSNPSSSSSPWPERSLMGDSKNDKDKNRGNNEDKSLSGVSDDFEVVYDASIDAGADVFFSTVGAAAFHAAIPPTVRIMDESYIPGQQDGIELVEAVENLEEVFKRHNGVAMFIRGAAMSPSLAIDAHFSSTVSTVSRLFKLPIDGIQRGRDHGMPNYNDARAAYNLSRATSFANVTSDKDVEKKLRDVYDNDISKLDALTGALAESNQDAVNLVFGELLTRVWGDQMYRTMTGDRFWRNISDALDVPKNLTLKELVRRSINVTDLSDSPFVVPEVMVCYENCGTGNNLVALSSEFSLRWDISNDEIEFTLYARGVSDVCYLGIGFGGTTMTEADDFLVCTVDGGYASCVDRAPVSSRTEPRPDSKNSNLDVIGVSVETEVTSVTFRRRAIDLDDEDYNIFKDIEKRVTTEVIFAYNDGKFGLHPNTNRGAAIVDFSHGTSSKVWEEDQDFFIFHGALILAAWMFFATAGIYYARYCKGEMVLWGSQWWQRHAVLMVVASELVLPLSISAIFSAQDNFSTSHAKWGLYMIAGIILQLATGWLRAKALEGKQNNFSFFHRINKYVHIWCGRFAYLAGVMECYRGLELVSSTDNLVFTMYDVSYEIGLFDDLYNTIFPIWVGVVFTVFLLLEARIQVKRYKTEGATRLFGIFFLKNNAFVPGESGEGREGERRMMARTNDLPLYHMEEFNYKVLNGESWVIVDGAILDVSTFYGRHPGGSRIIMNALGTDITGELLGDGRSIGNAVSSSPQHVHSKDAWGIVRTLVVGYIHEGEHEVDYESEDRDSDHGEIDSENEKEGHIHQGASIHRDQPREAPSRDGMGALKTWGANDRSKPFNLSERRGFTLAFTADGSPGLALTAASRSTASVGMSKATTRSAAITRAWEEKTRRNRAAGANTESPARLLQRSTSLVPGFSGMEVERGKFILDRYHVCRFVLRERLDNDPDSLRPVYRYVFACPGEAAALAKAISGVCHFNMRLMRQDRQTLVQRSYNASAVRIVEVPLPENRFEMASPFSFTSSARVGARKPSEEASRLPVVNESQQEEEYDLEHRTTKQASSTNSSTPLGLFFTRSPDQQLLAPRVAAGISTSDGPIRRRVPSSSVSSWFSPAFARRRDSAVTEFEGITSRRPSASASSEADGSSTDTAKRTVLKVVPADESLYGELCVEMRIKLYPDGAMSKLLERLATVRDNATVQLQGPFPAEKLGAPPAYPNVVMIAAGTGINPMVQLIRDYRSFESADEFSGGGAAKQEGSRMSLIWQVAKPSDFYCLKELESLKAKMRGRLEIATIVNCGDGRLAHGSAPPMSFLRPRNNWSSRPALEDSYEEKTRDVEHHNLKNIQGADRASSFFLSNSTKDVESPRKISGRSSVDSKENAGVYSFAPERSTEITTEKSQGAIWTSGKSAEERIAIGAQQMRLAQGKRRKYFADGVDAKASELVVISPGGSSRTIVQSDSSGKGMNMKGRSSFFQQSWGQSRRGAAAKMPEASALQLRELDQEGGKANAEQFALNETAVPKPVTRRAQSMGNLIAETNRTCRPCIGKVTKVHLKDALGDELVRELGELKKQRRRYRASSAQRAEEKTDAGAFDVSAMMCSCGRMTNKLQVVVSGPGGFVFKVEAMLDEIGVPPEAIVSLD